MAGTEPYGVAGRKTILSKAGGSHSQVEEDVLQSEEMGEVVDTHGADGNRELVVRPLEITPLRSRSADSVEIIHVDRRLLKFYIVFVCFLSSFVIAL